MRTSIALSLAALALAACHSSSQPAQEPPSARAELEVTVSMYSGRTDPSFVLVDASAIAELAAWVRDAAPAPDFEGESVLRSILGYRGVLVRNPSGAGGLPRDLIVFDGYIEVCGEPPRFLRDEGRTLERWLIDRAVEAGAIDAVELAMVRER